MYLKIVQPYIAVLLLLTIISIVSYAVATQNFSKKMNTISTTNFTVDIVIAIMI